MADRIGAYGGAVAVLIFFALVASAAFAGKLSGLVQGTGAKRLKSLRLILDCSMVAITLVVLAVPEGLPMAVTISLGVGMREIRQDNDLVRKMQAAATIGCVTVICSDKTGTLTKNQMDVREVTLQGKRFEGDAVLSAKDSPAFDLLAMACAVELHGTSRAHRRARALRGSFTKERSCTGSSARGFITRSLAHAGAQPALLHRGPQDDDDPDGERRVRRVRHVPAGQRQASRRRA